MIGDEIPKYFDVYGVSRDNSIVIGSGVLEALGLRKARDIDLVVSGDEFARLAESEKFEPDQTKDCLWGGLDMPRKIEVWRDWTSPTTDEPVDFDDLLKYSTEIDGVKYVTPDYLLGWKQSKNREKDQADVILLRNFLNQQGAKNE